MSQSSGPPQAPLVLQPPLPSSVFREECEDVTVLPPADQRGCGAERMRRPLPSPPLLSPPHAPETLSSRPTPEKERRGQYFQEDVQNQRMAILC